MGIAAILGLVSSLVPVATDLIATLAKIKQATEDDHPEVWAAVKSQWDEAFAKWKEISP